MICQRCQTENEQGGKFCGACGAPLVQRTEAQMGVQTWIVGSGNACDIRLDAPSVSARHLEVLALNEGRFKVRDLNSTNGTYYLGQPVQEAEVDRRDILQLGLHPFQMSRVEATRRAMDFSSEASVLIGRAAPADIVLPFEMISGSHCELRRTLHGFQIRDVGSTNGTYLNGNPVHDWTPVVLPASVSLGSFQVPRASLEQWLARLGRSQSTTSTSQINIPEDGRLIVGRDPDCDIPIDAPQVSWHHAEIVSKQGRWVVRDLKSSNGVFLNGSRIKVASFHPTDDLSLGSHHLKLQEHQISAAVPSVGGVQLDALNVSRIVSTDSGPLTILDTVEVSIYPGEMVALMGPSGAGKSTLLEVLTGQRRPETGEVRFNGHCLHTHFQQLKDQIGYVPQDDIMHRDLTVFEVLLHVARSWDPYRPRVEMHKDVYNVLASMGLSHIAESKVGGTSTIRGISGGQRKRVNIAMELLKQPKLLFLDEPTSGLDARATMEVIRLLRELANNGTTIVMTIHQPRIEAFQLMSNLLLLTKGGKLAYFGEANPGAATYFEKRSKLPRHPEGNPADYVIDVLDPESEADMRATAAWQQDYLQSAVREKFVRQRQGQSENGPALGTLLGSERRRVNRIDAYWGLTTRYAKRKLRDRTALIIQLLQAPIVAVLLGWLFYNSELDVVGVPPSDWVPGIGGVHQVLFLLSATAFWFGCSNVAREIVADRSVFRRERRGSLSVGAYLGSIFSVQLALSFVQVSALVLITWPIVQLSFWSFLPSLALLMMTSATGVALGLLVSAFARTEVTALSLVPVLLIPQLMFSGYLKLFRNMADDSILQTFMAAITPMRWCFEGLLFFEFEHNDSFRESVAGRAILIDGGPHPIEEIYGFRPWSGEGSDWFSSVVELSGNSFVLVCFITIFAFLTYLRLYRTGQSSNS